MYMGYNVLSSFIFLIPLALSTAVCPEVELKGVQIKSLNGIKISISIDINAGTEFIPDLSLN